MLFTDYYAVRIWGAPFELANYAFIGWFSGQGKPKAVFHQQLTISVIFILIKPLSLSMVTSIDEVTEIAIQFYLFAALAPLVSVIAYQFDGVMFGLTANNEIRNGMITVAISFFPVSIILP